MLKRLGALLLVLAAFFMPMEVAQLDLSSEAKADFCWRNCEEGCAKCRYILAPFSRFVTGDYSATCTEARDSSGTCDCCSTDYVGYTSCHQSGNLCYGVVVEIEPSPAG